MEPRTVEGFAKRYFWIVYLVGLTLLAYLTARVVNNVIAGEIAALQTSPPATTAQKTKLRTMTRGQTREWAESIANRNLFNSEPPEEDGGFSDTDSGVRRPDGVPPGPFDACDKSEAKLSLMATMVAEPSDWSRALMDDGESENGRIIKEQQNIGDFMLVSIHRHRVVLSSGSGFECIELGAKKSRKKKKKKRDRSSNSSSNKAKFKESIKKTGRNEYAIDRGFLDEQLADLSKLGRQARVIPHYRDGKPQGFKIVGVRPNSLYSHIGVRSGDVIKAVSGEEITSPNKALELYERLKNSDNVTVDVERRGRKVTLEYNIK